MRIASAGSIPNRMATSPSGRYVPLRFYLGVQRKRQAELALTFREIEDVLGDGLPKPARKYPEWWANDPANEQATAWLEAGYWVREADLEGERVLFGEEPT
ncbi:MAG TPA: hypothetical protein VNL71_01520 [Chloroflexota bacterium]|nr:hypothetical protein [Chloroflexota bacterium]